MTSLKSKEKILEELGGLPVEIYDELVAEHFSLVKEKIHELHDLLGRCNYEEFCRVAHSIKSSSANLRLAPFQELGAEMEAASRDEVDRELLVQSVEKLEKLIARVESEGLP